MNTHKLSRSAVQPFEFSMLKKSDLREKEYKISLMARSYQEKGRNLLIFSVLYGIIIGSLVFMLLNS